MSKINIFLGGLLVIFAVSIVFFQLSIINFWPNPWQQINLLVPILVFIFLLTGRSLALVFAIASGWLLDIFSFYIFGLNLLSLIIIVFLINWWWRQWLTKHSVYSFIALVLVANLVKSLFFYSLLFLLSDNYRHLWQAQAFWRDLAWEALASMILAVFLFYIALALDRRLKPFFVSRRPLVNS